MPVGSCTAGQDGGDDGRKIWTWYKQLQVLISPSLLTPFSLATLSSAPPDGKGLTINKHNSLSGPQTETEIVGERIYLHSN
ncbi:hypothetical protein ATANTOWER_024046 [Ataeniobius toweri]|uniref:Uncharacterized protein n=1 Tax=Ataeniobius toweri TaxID=208326 RepID=A0ABU7AB38_9TELE|nr:hypothetical protein [Ataeniobius toweri]